MSQAVTIRRGADDADESCTEVARSDSVELVRDDAADVVGLDDCSQITARELGHVPDRNRRRQTFCWWRGR